MASGEQNVSAVDGGATVVSGPVKVLKHDDLFGIFDEASDCGRGERSAEGLFFRDTRYLSRWELRVGGRSPLLLSSEHDDDGSALTTTLANRALDGVAKDLIGITRTKFLWSGCCHERLSLRNYDLIAHTVQIEIVFDADFKDLFEIRGSPRSRVPPQRLLQPSPEAIQFSYQGLDGIARATEVTFDPAPDTIAGGYVNFEVRLPPSGTRSLVTRVCCSDAAQQGSTTGIVAAYRAKMREAHQRTLRMPKVTSSNDVFNDLLCRCADDLAMLSARTEHGQYPHAGIPWYSTTFGRDGIITALFMLWADPDVAKGVLLHLAATQATGYDAASDAEPGKILHERRQSEMANTGEVPFRQYYGTVDATPLFVVLAGAYWRRTRDLDTILAIWPHVQAALGWCAYDGDRDGDGFIEYHRQTPDGLANQGWKDSHDSVFHADGRLAEGPIALVEVQGYAYQAYRHGAELADVLGDSKLARDYDASADRLKAAFHDAFWAEEIGTYALALDRHKAQCRVVASNAGHLLLSDLVPEDVARRVGRKLVDTGLWSGWGVRTLATDMPRYNPMSYHNGSIWPHDNGLIAMGLGRIGMKREAAQIFEGLYAAQSYQTDNRLPELFCGAPRRRRRGPVSYPVSCSPQAWAAAAPFAMVEACLGLEIDQLANTLTLRQPMLPAMLTDITLGDLRVGQGSVSLRLTQTSGGVATEVTQRTGDVVVNVLN